MVDPEIIDINDLDSGNTININNSMDDVNIGGSRSSNFGSGIELLMNNKMKSSSGNALSSDIDVDDLDNLENELNGIALLKCNAVVYTKTSFFIRWEISQFKIKKEKPKEIYNEYMIIDLPEHSVYLNCEIDNIESKLENVTLF